MKNVKDEFIPFSEWFEREMKDPEFRAAYDALEEEEVVIRAEIEAKIRAKRIRKQNGSGVAGIPQFTT